MALFGQYTLGFRSRYCKLLKLIVGIIVFLFLMHALVKFRVITKSVLEHGYTRMQSFLILDAGFFILKILQLFSIPFAYSLLVYLSHIRCHDKPEFFCQVLSLICVEAFDFSCLLVSMPIICHN